MVIKIRVLKTVVLLSILALSFGLVQAQISGNFTVGGTSPNYHNLDSVVKDLNAKGVNGPVVFKLRSGVYTERMYLLNIKGVSSVNTIQFIPDTAGVSKPIIKNTATGTSDNYCVKFYQTKYVSFKHIKFISDDPTYCRIVELLGSSEYINFDSCEFQGAPTNSISTNACLINNNSNVRDSIKNCRISYCRIENGSWGIGWWGSVNGDNEHGNSFIGNKILNFFVAGIYAYYQDELEILDNYIEDSSATEKSTALRVLYTSGQSKICRNRIISHSITSSVLLEVGGAISSDASKPTLVCNNFVSQLNQKIQRHAYGIQISSCKNLILGHNSVLLSGGGQATEGRPMNLNASISGSSGNVQVLNNCIVNTGIGFGPTIESSAISASMISKMDFNNYYISGADFAGYGSATYTSFSAWKSGTSFDKSSVELDPRYSSNIDLHVNQLGLNGKGTPISSITEDIDGETRSTSAPDIGADEFTPLKNDLAVVRIRTDLMQLCESDSTPLEVEIYNAGENNQSNFLIYLEIEGKTILSDTVKTQIKSNEFVSYTFKNASTKGGGTLKIKAICNLSTDQKRSNDTLTTYHDIIKSPSKPIPTNDTVCRNGQSTISATHDPGTGVHWYTSKNAVKAIAKGDSYRLGRVDKDTQIWVSSYRNTPIDSLKASSSANLGCSGVMFDIVPKHAIVVNDFSAYFTKTGAHNVAIYYRKGSFKGYETTRNQWILHDSVQVWVSSNSSPTAIESNIDLTILAGERYAFYIDGGFYYSLTSDTFSNNDIEMQNGAALCGRFSQVTQNRSLSGFVIYHKDLPCESERVPSQIKIHKSPELNLGVDTSFCTGDPFALTLDAGPSYINYLWNDNSAGRTLKVTKKGTYSVQVYDSNFCIGLDEINIAENPLPKFTLGPDTSVCDNGFWGYELYAPKNHTYFWHDSTTDYSHHANEFRTYFVRITDSNSCSASDTLQVIPLAVPFVDLGNDTSYCKGANFSLSLDAGSGHAKYLWSNGSSTQAITASQRGTYLVRVENTHGCWDEDSLRIDELDNPVVHLGQDTQYCQSDGISLTSDAGPGFNSYKWSTGETTQSILISSSGSYSVEVTDSNLCAAADTFAVTMNANPIVHLGADTLLNPSSVVNLTLNAGSSFSSYLWSDGSKNSTLTISDTGIYSVEVWDKNGCVGMDTIHVNFWNPMGLNPDLFWDISFHPNPSNGSLTIVNPNIKKIDWIIYSVEGKVVSSGLVYEMSNLLDLSTIHDGIYLLQLKVDSDFYFYRFSLVHN
jgi:hypothetical protein